MDKIRIKIILVMFLLLIPFFCFAADGQARSITVTGESTVKVAPDNVVINLTVESVNLDLKAARSENNAKVKSILDLCKKENIASDDVKTSQISVSPRYKYEGQRNVYVGMAVQQSLGITLKDILRYNSFLDKLLSLKTRYVNNVAFKTSELKKYRDQARSLALDAAKDKAQKLAAGLSQKIGKPLMIQEGFVPDAGIPYYYGLRGSQMQTMAQESGDSSDYNGTGLIDVAAMITVTFELTD